MSWATRRKAEVLLEPRSLVVIADESCYEWTLILRWGDKGVTNTRKAKIK